jgi:hypothetical protein
MQGDAAVRPDSRSSTEVSSRNACKAVEAHTDRRSVRSYRALTGANAARTLWFLPSPLPSENRTEEATRDRH